MISRHNSLRDVFAVILRRLRITPKREQYVCLPYNQKAMDVTFVLDGVTYWCDFALIHMSAVSYVNRLRTHEVPGAAAAHREHTKTASWQKWADSAQAKFVPCVMESSGRIAPQFDELLSTLCFNFYGNAASKKKKAAQLKWDIVQEISCTVMRATARLMHTSASLIVEQN